MAIPVALLATLGAGLCVTGASLGIGRLTSSFMDGTARQPAASADLRTGMVLAASFIEGLGLLGLLICLIAATKTATP